MEWEKRSLIWGAFSYILLLSLTFQLRNSFEFEKAQIRSFPPLVISKDLFWKKNAPDEEKFLRLTHARELLGKYYQKSIVRVGERVRNVRGFLRAELKQNLTKKFKSQSNKIARAILQESDRYSFDPIFLMAVMESESSLNPLCKGKFGEIGLMQIKPDTAEWISHKYRLKWKGAKSLFNPITNIRIGAAYFDFLRDRFENHSRLYLSAYNMGQRNVTEAVDNGVWPKDYASRVMQNYVKIYGDLRETIRSRPL